METIKGAVLYEYNEPVVVEEMELGDPGQGEVLVEMKASGVCHSDWHVVKGEWWDIPAPVILGQALNYPCLTDDLSADSYARHADSPGLKTDLMEQCWDFYLQGKRPTDAPYAAPLRTPDVSDLPPAHIHYAEYDPLADDGPAYAERLRAAGNEVELRCAERMIHGFMRARFSGPDAAAEFDRPCGFIRRVLGL